MINHRDLQGVGEYVYYRDVQNDIRDYISGKKEIIKAETTHFGDYDQHFKWLRTEVTGFAGIPNHGKSKYMVFLTALKMYYDNWKVAVYSPETTPSVFFFANYIHTFTGFNLFGNSKPHLSQLAKYEALLENNLYLCDPEKMPTIKGIFERFQKAYETHGCDMFVIDPFNCLEREWETSRRDDRFVGDFLDHFKEFSKNTNTCGIVVMHPNSGIRPAKGEMDYECPNMYNLAGGAMWGNKLDNLLFIHRPQFISNFRHPEVLIRHSKIKKREIVGRGGDANIEFNYLNNRYTIAGYEPEFKEGETKQQVLQPAEAIDLPF